MKTLVFYVKDKLPCHKNSFFICINLLYVCTYVYHKYERICSMYKYFHVFLVVFGIENDSV